MSIEPKRKPAYAVGRRVVWQRLSLGLAYYAKISKRLNISVSTARRTYILFQATGDVSPISCKVPRIRRYMRKLNDDLELFITDIVLERPSLRLCELCLIIKEVSGTTVSPPTVCRLVKRHGFSRKKVSALQR